MQIQDFVNKISDCVSDYLMKNDYVINRALVTQLSNEIFARLLVLSLTESTECSLYYSTINSYNNKRHSNVSKTVKVVETNGIFDNIYSAVQCLV